MAIKFEEFSGTTIERELQFVMQLYQDASVNQQKLVGIFCLKEDSPLSLQHRGIVAVIETATQSILKFYFSGVYLPKLFRKEILFFVKSVDKTGIINGESFYSYVAAWDGLGKVSIHSEPGYTKLIFIRDKIAEAGLLWEQRYFLAVIYNILWQTLESIFNIQTNNSIISMNQVMDNSVMLGDSGAAGFAFSQLYELFLARDFFNNNQLFVCNPVHQCCEQWRFWGIRCLSPSKSGLYSDMQSFRNTVGLNATSMLNALPRLQALRREKETQFDKDNFFPL